MNDKLTTIQKLIILIIVLYVGNHIMKEHYYNYQFFECDKCKKRGKE